jgi:hypothetical protein
MTRQQRRLLVVVEASSLAWELQELAGTFKFDKRKWACRARATYTPVGLIMSYEYSRSFTATSLLKELHDSVSPASRGQLPKTPHRLGIELNRLREGLQLKGIELSYRRYHRYGRLWEIRVTVMTPLMAVHFTTPLPPRTP